MSQIGSSSLPRASSSFSHVPSKLKLPKKLQQSKPSSFSISSSSKSQVNENPSLFLPDVKKWCSSFNPLFVALFHLKRGLLAPLTSELATPTEKKTLKEKLGVQTRGTLNLLAWRRSTMGLAILATVMASWFQVLDVQYASDMYDETVRVANQNVTYGFEVQDIFDFRGYSRR